MQINLTERATPYAIYIPSMQLGSAEGIVGSDEQLRASGLPAGLAARDFNYLDPNNRFWHYNYALATAAHFKGKKTDNAINTRDPSNVIMGDSSGFQLGHGTLGDISSWNALADNPAKIMAKWRASSLKEDIYKWQAANSTLALTLDMPIWSIGNPSSPFRNLSADELTTLSVENLRYLEEHSARFSGTQFLNVLQGTTEEQEENWFQAVKSFKGAGWSLAGNVGQMGGIYRVLRRILLLRDEKLLEAPRSWMHILRLSRVRWAPVMTAIQRAVRNTVNRDFTVSYDSSSPYRIGGMITRYAALDKFGSDMAEGWTIRSIPFPAGFAYANDPIPRPLNLAHQGFLPEPLESPIASMLTVRDLNPKGGDFAPRTFDGFSDELIINHNVYIYVLANIMANEAVFSQTPTAPQQLLDAVGIISDLFRVENWAQELKSKAAILGSVVGDSKNDYGIDDGDVDAKEGLS